MKNKQYDVENFILNIISFTIIAGFVYIYLIRFIPKIPKEVFIPVCLERGMLYLIMLLSNMLLLTFIIYSKKNNNNKLTILKLLVKDLNEIIKNALYKARAILVSPKYMQLKINTIIRLFMYIFKTYTHSFQILSYTNQLLLLVTLSIDTFYFEYFFYSYIAIYCLIGELFLRFILSLCQTRNEELQNEITHSIVIANPARIIEGLPPLLEDHELTKYNKIFKSVKDVLDTREICMLENNYLYEIEYSFYGRPFMFKVFLRICYIIIWSYIMYYYPYPIVKNLAIIIYSAIKPFVNIIIILILTLMGVIINNALNKK